MSKYRYHKDGTLPKDDSLFVFGSNLSGRHGRGAALVARNRFKARYGIGVGRTGQAYAIPTKDSDKYLTVLSLKRIRFFIRQFREHTKQNREETYFVTRVGCGLAQYSDEQIASLFRGATRRCSFPIEWKPFLE